MPLISSAVYAALPRALRSATIIGEWFPTGGRVRWRLFVGVAALATDVTVRLEGRAAGGTPRLIFESVIDETGEYAFSSRNGDFAVTTNDEELRVTIPAHTGDYLLKAEIGAPFLDPTEDANDLLLLTPRLRNYADVERIVFEAEDDILNLARVARDADGRLECLGLDLPRFLDQMQLAIARQAERRYMIDQLREAGTAEALTQLSELETVAPEILGILEPYFTCPDPGVEDEDAAGGYLLFAGRSTP